MFTRSNTDVGTFAYHSKIHMHDPEEWDNFGISVSLYGDTALIGANGRDDNNKEGSGSVYVFTRSSPDGMFEKNEEQPKLHASIPETDESFGVSVSFYGNTALIGAPHDDYDNVKTDSGSVYVFTRSSTDGTFTELSTKLHASNPEAGYHFGESVSLYGDTALIGATYDDDNGKSKSGSVYVFTRSSTDGTFTERSKLHASNAAGWDRFGISVSLYGNTALIGAHGRDDENDNTITNVGSVYVFKAPIVCSTNEYVSSHVCTPCDPGTTNDAGDDAWGSDTACNATLCSANERVVSHVCTTCPPGTTNAAGNLSLIHI